jgi:alpha-L-fucosidase
VTTQRGDSVFVHVLDWPDRMLAIPGLGARILRASLLATGQPVAFVSSGDGLTLTLPPGRADEPDQVVVLVTGRVRP